MKIYLDYIFFINFLFDLLLLLSVSIILRRNIKFKKIVFGALLGGASIFLLFIKLNNINLFLFKIIISIIMILITFGYKNLKYTIKNLIYLYMSSMILGGVLYFLNIEFSYYREGLIFYHNGLSVNVIILIVLSPIIIHTYIKQIMDIKNNYSNYYKVDIYLKESKKITLTAFLDTGNKLIDPYKRRPIILIKKSLIDVSKQKIILVPYNTVNNSDLLKCIVPEKIYIQNVGIKKNFLIGLMDEVNIEGVDCILNTKLLERI